jgi:hypothetical protein
MVWAGSKVKHVHVWCLVVCGQHRQAYGFPTPAMPNGICQVRLTVLWSDPAVLIAIFGVDDVVV